MQTRTHTAHCKLRPSVPSPWFNQSSFLQGSLQPCLSLLPPETSTPGSLTVSGLSSYTETIRITSRFGHFWSLCSSQSQSGALLESWPLAHHPLRVGSQLTLSPQTQLPIMPTHTSNLLLQTLYFPRICQTMRHGSDPGCFSLAKHEKLLCPAGCFLNICPILYHSYATTMGSGHSFQAQFQQYRPVSIVSRLIQIIIYSTLPE